jgi:hypothetical protein
MSFCSSSADGGEKSLEFAWDVLAGRLVDDLSHTSIGEIGDPVAQGIWRPGQREGSQQLGTFRHSSAIPLSEMHEMAFVCSEVAVIAGERFDRR